jgi:hypothetical protein
MVGLIFSHNKFLKGELNMLKKTIAYTDFDNKDQTDDLYFHLTKAELVEFVSQYPGEFSDYVKKVSRAKDRSEFINLFRNIILKSYGLKEGPRFVKTPAIAEEFSHTEAYSALFFDLLEKTDNLIAFFSGVLGIDIEALEKEIEKK